MKISLKSGLFLAVITAFIIDGYKNLLQDSENITIALLMQISQQLAGASNGTHVGALVPPKLMSFQPSWAAVWVNVFWFLSLTFSLMCALVATLVQQWAQNYLQVVDCHPAPHRKAHIHTFLYKGIKSFGMRTVVEGIPLLLHPFIYI
ncbi:hypothetical protein PILCRDRAFT_65644 [Piloderma croceum F 1598]|uniref:DUF6535 domain-containing protein n=1 Tax=Piloderma croceum (strain F 1598) TaxID=765440 RepID=A0A0C3BIC9_PILCF|nr:hypothetical protein PILCRDRAFT_65644 [Piloderma croceum F 1598]